MVIELRNYQDDVDKALDVEYSSGLRNILAQMPTGAGKTVLFCHRIIKFNGISLALAHRQELVSQMSLTLAENGILHRILGSTTLIKEISALHIKKYGQSFHSNDALDGVMGVDTLISWCKTNKYNIRNYLNRVGQIIIDEAHHVVNGNKWGKAVLECPNAILLGVTATPWRGDGKGLDGVFQTMVQGVDMRWLIDHGFLSEYKVFNCTSDIDFEALKTGGSGDYTKDSMKKAVQGSHIVGDVVKEYIKHASGLQGITFTTDLETAAQISQQYNASGVPAEVVSSKTPLNSRYSIIEKFREGGLMQLVNVDIFGEGFDLPAIKCVSLARPTESLNLHIQQCGRALRKIPNVTTKAVILDHVNNIGRLNLPDAKRNWSLQGRSKRSKGEDDGAIPTKECSECTAVYPRNELECPECGYREIPAERSTPEQVDGDLTELSPEVLAQMRNATENIFRHQDLIREECMKKNIPDVGIKSAVKRHILCQDAQEQLRDTMSTWAGIELHKGNPRSKNHKTFYHKFKIDALTAQTLGEKEARALTLKIEKDLNE